MEKKYTPGPWRLIGGIKGYNLNAYILAKDRSSKYDRELQVLSIKDYHPIPEHNERRMADAALIAAAPDLLEALERILEIGNLTEAKFIARAAKAKATTINQP